MQNNLQLYRQYRERFCRIDITPVAGQTNYRLSIVGDFVPSEERFADDAASAYGNAQATLTAWAQRVHRYYVDRGLISKDELEPAL